ncbi:MAG: DUF1194 domain-containing protein [Pseudomonadota bacterium]
MKIFQGFMTALAVLAWPILPGLVIDKARAAAEVDLELVLAVDVSYSMDVDEQRDQRIGYAQAITSPEVLSAIRSGMIGKIAVSYMEWAGAYSQRTIVDWQVIDGEASAKAFADRLLSAGLVRIFRTSISEGLMEAGRMIEDNGYEGLRRVIDVSGDGPNNQGRLVVRARDALVAKGITINGLPIMIKRPGYNWYDIPNLDEYYRRCVIGGAGAFIVPVRERSDFAQAIRRKLVLEIAGRVPLVPHLVPAQSIPREPLCTIGERLWERRPDPLDF